MTYAFFGSSRLSVIVLDEMERLGYLPSFVVTTPDKPQGRKMAVAANVVKAWASSHGTQSLEFARLDAEAVHSITGRACDLYVVASYGRIMPAALIEAPKFKTLNVHPSLLPRYRGPSPLPTAILDDAKATGVTIMRMDEQVDHGPIVAQREISVSEWPIYEDFEELMARAGAELLVDVLPQWLAGEISARDQDHSRATFTRKFSKDDGLVDIHDPDQYKVFRTIQAFHQWPQAYFLMKRNGKQLRVKISQAAFANGLLEIKRVIPEGSREMAYRDFLSGYRP
ncbi:MAG: methionyl-tRNA formyltransferase [Patescibacteria group bacterium]|nr:methionyl-tRNA formyltransferase [Patescibacteria group bacterium]MDE2172618.1 methionyl-tRNA formyltransferase [Patescibacteria group bacterium]